jgi:hypothetical protein
MIHPMIVNTSGDVDGFALKEGKLQRIVDKPRAILWKRGEEYFWIPIEVVTKAIAWYNSEVFGDHIPFNIEDAMVLPKEIGDVIVKYNGHQD